MPVPQVHYAVHHRVRWPAFFLRRRNRECKAEKGAGDETFLRQADGPAAGSTNAFQRLWNRGEVFGLFRCSSLPLTLPRFRAGPSLSRRERVIQLSALQRLELQPVQRQQLLSQLWLLLQQQL